MYNFLCGQYNIFEKKELKFFFALAKHKKTALKSFLIFDVVNFWRVKLYPPDNTKDMYTSISSTVIPDR